MHSGISVKAIFCHFGHFGLRRSQQKHSEKDTFPRDGTLSTWESPDEKPCDRLSRKFRTKPKLKLLILDAGVVIYLHEIDLWQQVVANCDLYLSRIVAEKEVLFQKSERDEYGYDFDSSPLIKSGAIKVFDVSVSDLKSFRNQFDLLYLGDLDDGESESLAFLVKQPPDFLISSGDAIVYRVLGKLRW